jgi:hypothetical protein
LPSYTCPLIANICLDGKYLLSFAQGEKIMPNTLHQSKNSNDVLNLTNGQDITVRRKLSGPALRTFLKIAERWHLSPGEKLKLLGSPHRQTFSNWQRGKTHTTFDLDTLTRISLIIGIYKALHILYPEENFADAWVNMPNSNPLFQGRPAIDYMCGGSIDNLFRVRRLLDARRGSWS